MSSTVIDIGTPPDEDSGFNLEEYNATVHIHNFEEQGVHKKIISPNFFCAGREWALEIIPMCSGRAGYIKIYLLSRFKSTINVDYDLTVRGYTSHYEYNAMFPAENEYLRCWKDTRNKILKSNALHNKGTLTVHVSIRPYDESCGDSKCGDSNPDSKICKRIMSSLLNNKDDADVAFDVKGQLLYAHKIILKERAPDLVADFCDSCDNSNPVPIQDVDPAIFKAMLGHAYAQKIEPTMWKEHAKEIIEASGKYGFNDLKSQAEACYMKHKNLTVDTVIDELLYADSYNLNMLKKATMDFIVIHGGEVMASASYDRLYESPKLTKEVMSTFADRVSKKRLWGEG